MMPDLAVELLMPPLMADITKRAPNVRIDVVPWRGPAISRRSSPAPSTW